MPSVELIFGPMLFGVFLNTLLYGVLMLQAFIYQRTYKSDKTWIRCLVGYLFFVETLNTAFDWGTMYEPLVKRWGAERATKIVPVMLEADHVVMVMISTPVQLFIAWRIKIISGSSRLAGLIAFFAFSSFIGGFASTVVTATGGTVTFEGLQRIRGPIITWLASAATADVLITSSLVYSLRKRKTGIKSTDDAIDRIVRLTIQTGMITAIFAASDVILYTTSKETGLNFIFDFPLSKLYTNSLVSTLNARAGWDKLNSDDASNVLFGHDPNQTMIKTPHPGSKLSATTSQTVTGVFELDVRDRHVHGESKRVGDIEGGVSITQVVESFDHEFPPSKVVPN
ncbi:hypothetical protein EYR38_010802 [Pleurotus pulmonarius]|nr:hypothetical protein EYR38_010802 [Pleurotus pulmonarius]